MDELRSQGDVITAFKQRPSNRQVSQSELMRSLRLARAFEDFGLSVFDLLENKALKNKALQALVSLRDLCDEEFNSTAFTYDDVKKEVSKNDKSKKGR